MLGPDGVPSSCPRCPRPSCLGREPAKTMSQDWDTGRHPPARSTDDHLPPPAGCRGHCCHLAAPWAGAAQRHQESGLAWRIAPENQASPLSQSQYLPDSQCPDVDDKDRTHPVCLPGFGEGAAGRLDGCERMNETFSSP